MSLRSASRLPLAAGLLLGIFRSPACAETVFDSISQEVQAVFERSRKAIVRIEALDEHGKLSGTGFFIDPEGTVLTSYTVGGESHDITVLNGDMKFPATRSLADSRSGIAILKIESQTPFLPIGKSTALGVAAPDGCSAARPTSSTLRPRLVLPCLASAPRHPRAETAESR